MSKNHLKNVKVGDELWSPEFGYGNVIRTLEEDGNANYPLVVEFYELDETEAFTKDGRRVKGYTCNLFWQAFAIPEHAYKEPLPQLKRDTKLLVKFGSSNKWYPRHFFEWDKDGLPKCYNDGRTSFTAKENEFTHWPMWKLKLAD